MLTIPDDIKELLHRDSCYKNIRIHFPNGERSDICNDQIVMDSVSFTESLCSQDALKFGLCEASQFECEVVGVSNVKGATIEVYCEVYCDSSVSGAVWRVDLEAWVYPLPYGTFTIAECKRQADILHRRIVAYGIVSQLNSGLCNLEETKFSWEFSSSKTYTVNMFKFVMGNFSLRTYSDDMFNSTEMSSHETSGGGYTDFWQYDGKQYRCKYIIYKKGWDFQSGGSYPVSDVNNLFFLVATQKSRKDIADQANKFLEEYHYRSFGNIEKYFHAWDFGYDFWYDISGSDIAHTFRQSYNDDAELPYMFFPYFPGISLLDIGLPYRAEIEIQRYDLNTNQYVTIDTLAIEDIATSISLKKLVEKTGYYNSYTLSFQSRKRGGYYSVTKPSSNINNVTIFNSMLELKGVFGWFNHNDYLKLINIKQQFALLPSNTLYPASDLYPEGVTGGKLFPQDYQSCWYDDQYVKPFGAIQCKYKNTSNADCIFTMYLTGFNDQTPLGDYQVYVIDNNYIIQNSTFTQQQIEDICNTIAANISGVTYMPVEFVGRGLPYVEAGDTFEILTASNDSITTIVLRRTLSGEMVLTDSYKSV